MVRRLNLKRRIGPSLRQGPRKARSAGAKFNPSNSVTLQLDMDTEHQQAQYAWMLPYVRRFMHVEIDRVTEGRTGKGKHVYLTLAHPLTDIERIALQVILGSDPMREWLGLLRCWGGVRDPIQLFEKESDAGST